MPSRPTAQGYLFYHLAFWIVAGAIVGIAFIVVSTGLLTGLLREVPDLLALYNADGQALPIRFQHVELLVLTLVWTGAVATYLLRRWGILLFTMGFGVDYLLRLASGEAWSEALGVFIWPALLVALGWRLIFSGRTTDMPQVQRLR